MGLDWHMDRRSYDSLGGIADICSGSLMWRRMTTDNDKEERREKKKSPLLSSSSLVCYVNPYMPILHNNRPPFNSVHKMGDWCWGKNSGEWCNTQKDREGEKARQQVS